jgi:outer membrane protein
MTPDPTISPARPTRRARRLVPLALAAALLAPTLVAAQSLLDVYEAARGYDAAYLAAKAQAESTKYRAEQAEALLRPSAALSGSLTRQETDPPVVDRRNLNNAQLAIQGRQPLFNRANGAAVEQARRSLEAAAADLEAAEQDLILRVSQAYFDVLAAQDTLATVQASKKFITEQLASARRNFEVGNATITDTREAQARFDLVTAQEIAADNDLRTRRIALDQLVGRMGVAPKGLATPVVLPPVTPDAVDDWVNRGQSEHPAIRRATTALEIARLETERARAGNLPTVDLVGSVSSSRSTGSAVAPPTSRPGTTNGASVGVQLNLPLYTGGSVQNRIRETLALEERSRNDLDAARRGVAQGTRQAFFGVQSGQAQVKALEAAESSSQLALEATQTGYRVGVRVNLDVLNAQSQLFSTRRDLARARYDVLLGSLRLRQASGRLVASDVAALNGLLAP